MTAVLRYDGARSRRRSRTAAPQWRCTRCGLVLTAFRSRLHEGWAWFLSGALFGLMHLVNAALGAPLGSTLVQVLMAFASGTAFYIVRRVTGSLIWAMLLHGLWDVSVFAVGHAPLGVAYASFLAPVVGVLALAVVYWVIKGTDEKTVEAAPAPA